MNLEKSQNLGTPDHFFHGEMDIRKRCGLIQPHPHLRPIRVKGKIFLKFFTKSAQKMT